MVPAGYQVWAAGLLLLGGLIACFAGYRLFRVVLAIYGCIFGALIATSLFGGGSTPALLIAAGVGGLAGAAVLFLGYFAGVAFVGAGFGALVAHLGWSAFGSEPPALAVILLSVAGAFGAMALQRYVIVAGTALGGAWTIIVAAVAILGNQRALAAGSDDVWVVYPLDPAPGRRGIYVAWVVISLVGVLVQLSAPGGSRKKKR